MEVEVPRAFIFDFDSIKNGPTVLIRNNCWELYEKIRDSLVPLDLGLDVNSAALEKLANILAASASVSVGWLEIRLTFLTVAIWAVLGYVSVSRYEIVSYPAIFGKAQFPFRLGAKTYEIEPIES